MSLELLIANCRCNYNCPPAAWLVTCWTVSVLFLLLRLDRYFASGCTGIFVFFVCLYVFDAFQLFACLFVCNFYAFRLFVCLFCLSLLYLIISLFVCLFMCVGRDLHCR